MTTREFRFLSATSQWHGFMTALALRNRHVAHPAAIADVLAAAATRVHQIQENELLYRARILPPNYDYRGPQMYAAEDMRQPPIQYASGGRLNPTGIPYLYLAREPATAVAEVQPWKSAFVTVASFRTLRAFNIVDLATPSDEPSYNNHLIRRMGHAFSEPAHRQDPTAYAATQFLSELLKAEAPEGCMGVQYPSALHTGGVNIALFGWGRSHDFEGLVACEHRELVRVGSVDYSYAKEEPRVE